MHLNISAAECQPFHLGFNMLTHWDRVTHIWVGNLTILGSDNGLSPGRRQAIIWTNAEILLIGPLGTNFSEILIEIQTFSLKKICLEILSAKCCSFRLGLNVLTWIFCAYLHIDNPRDVRVIVEVVFARDTGCIPGNFIWCGSPQSESLICSSQILTEHWAIFITRGTHHQHKRETTRKSHINSIVCIICLCKNGYADESIK